MPTNHADLYAPGVAPDEESLIGQVLAFPEPEALQCYAGLSTQMQWRARKCARGQRRAALIEYHVLKIAVLR